MIHFDHSGLQTLGGGVPVCPGFKERTLYLFSYLFCLFRAIPEAYEGSQTGWGSNQSCSLWPTPQPQQRQIWARSFTYNTAHGNAGSLTHWVRPGIEPTSSGILVRFISIEPQQELQEPTIIPVSYLSMALHLASVKCYTSFFLLR